MEKIKPPIKIGRFSVPYSVYNQFRFTKLSKGKQSKKNKRKQSKKNKKKLSKKNKRKQFKTKLRKHKY